jgi:hypothetical protein
LPEVQKVVSSCTLNPFLLLANWLLLRLTGR